MKYVDLGDGEYIFHDAGKTWHVKLGKRSATITKVKLDVALKFKATPPVEKLRGNLALAYWAAAMGSKTTPISELKEMHEAGLIMLKGLKGLGRVDGY
jgi:hypothetical protein